MSVNEVVQLKIIVIFSKWIDQSFSNFHPSHVECKLKQNSEQAMITLQGLAEHWFSYVCN